MILVDTYEEFSNAVRQNWKNISIQNSAYSSSEQYSPYASINGGFWMGSKDSEPTVMVNIRQPRLVSRMMNFYTVMASGVGISSSYYAFATTRIPSLIDLKPMIFIVYFGLIMSW
jgi:ATP-binding cassette subfamily A (ABC1) protein 3